MRLSKGPSEEERDSEETTLLEDVPNLDHFNFKLNLEPYDEYYNIIDDKTRNLEHYFSQPSASLIARKGKSGVTIREVESLTGFKLLVNFKLPCNYAYYSQISRNQEVSQQMSSVFGSSSIDEAVHSNLTIETLRLNKFMLLEPRFFHYLKYQNSTGKSHWEICLSTKVKPNSNLGEK